MDHIDRKILKLLQSNGRITNLDLAEQVNLSPTACQNRVKKLESSGIISGYRAVIDPVAAGYNISGLILIKMANNTRDAVTAFREAVNAIPSVTECHMTSGKIDYVVRLYAKDFVHYETLVQDDLATLPHINSMETLYLFSNVVPGGVINVIA